jgi:hypothetical protein
MPFIRPSPPTDYFDARQNQLGDQINNKKLVAGNGISITQGTAGTIISLADNSDSSMMRFKGVYNPTSSYWPNDVVVVTSQSYTDNLGNPIPLNTGSGYQSGSIVYGTYICLYFVPDATQTIALLESTIASYYTNSGGTITPDLANTYRDGTINSYYPTNPINPATMSLVAQSDWQATTNIPFWYPLVPYVPVNSCTAGGTQQSYVAAYI